MFNHFGTVPFKPCDQYQCAPGTAATRLLFYVPLTTEKLSPASRVLWLVCPARPKSDKRIALSRDGKPDEKAPTIYVKMTTRIHRNDVYVSTVPSKLFEDHWLAEPVVYPATSKAWDVHLHPMEKYADKPVLMRVRVLGPAIGDGKTNYSLSLSLNSSLVAKKSLNGPTFSIMEGTVTASSLASMGSNALTISSLVTGAMGKPPLYLDWIEVQYWGVPHAGTNVLYLQTMLAASKRGTVSIPGYTESAVHVLDVTSRNSPEYINGVSHIGSSGTLE